MSVGGMTRGLMQAAQMAGSMAWELLWPLILGFSISAVIQAVVSHREMARLLPDERPRSILIASLLGAASSSCSYAAVAIARGMVRKGADFRAAMAFQFASTNLVVELGIVLWVMLGWRFTAATWAGGIVMIVILSGLLRLFLSRRLVEEASAQAEKGVPGRMEGHAAMDDMSVTGGPLLKRLASPAGFTAVSHYFVMDWASVWIDLVVGVLIAAALATWIPHTVWSAVFATGDPRLSRLIGPLLGPLIAVASFVCSIGNVPLAAVLWTGGASFGGVIAFIFGDLIVLPILDIYRRYYGLKAAAVLFALFYASMVLAGYAVEFTFRALGWAPTVRSVHIVEQGLAWSYTTWLDLGFLALAAVLVWRFMATGGPQMLRHMEHADGGHHHHHRPAE
jgi:hypothetical protein